MMPKNSTPASGRFRAEWARTDPYSAGAWATELPEGEQRDAAAVGLAGAIAQSDPERAWEWVERIQTDQARFDAAKGVLAPMIDRDRAGALRWLEGSGIPEEDKTRLREELFTEGEGDR